MLLRSNLKAVIRNLEDYQEGLTPAVQRAIAPDKRWRDFLAGAATRVLSGLADETQQDAVTAFVATLSYSANDVRVVWRMVVGASDQLAVGVQRRLPGTPGGDFDRMEIGDDSEGELRQRIYDWVTQEKEWDIERDGERTLENEAHKAEWLHYILTSPTLASGAEQAARDSFLGSTNEHGLLAAITRAEETAGVDAATAKQWAQAVLLTWRELVPDELFHRLRKELNALRTQIKRGELSLA